jgi:site-specific DNA-methyltransferase (adenine-specific)
LADWRDKFLDKVVCGDCLELMKELPDGCVDLVVTDPPYGISLDLKWLSSLHIQRGKPANKCDEPIVGDEKLIPLESLYRFPRRIIFGFPYIYDEGATGWLVWDKQPGLRTERTLGNPVELASSTVWSGFRMKRVMWAGYYREGGESRYEHPTQKPYRLFADLIAEHSLSGDIILDPFLGSGTTAVAAKQLGRHFIGIEINPKYCEIAERRLSQEVLAL